MSQTVHLDMQVLQRIKFLMEYDVMKTSSENFLVEQSTDLQKLAKEKGFGPVSLSKAQELYNQGKLGNSVDIQGNPDYTSGQAKVIASRDPAVQKANKEKSGTIDVARTDVSKMYSRLPQDVKDQTLEELTMKVRNIMTDWRTATVETLMTVVGVGIPVVITANGIWFTLEVTQALNGNPDYLNLAFSFIALATAGTQSAALKPLYQAVSKDLKGRGKDFVYVLELLYFHAKELGLWKKLEPVFKTIKGGSKTVIDRVIQGFTWLFNSKFAKGLTWMGKGIGNVLSRVTSFVSGLFDSFDNWLADVAIKGGVNPQVAQKLGSATRWGGVPYVIHSVQDPSGSKFVLQDYEVKPGSYSKPF